MVNVARKNGKRRMKTETCGEGTPSLPGKQDGVWHRFSIRNDNVEPKLRAVAWIDIMGGKNFMWRSMSSCAIFIGKLYAAVEYAVSKQSPNPVRVFRMSDGVYVCGDEFSYVRDVVDFTMHQCACDFLNTSDNHHRFLLRAAIAYGSTIIGEDLKAQNPDCSFLDSMIIGAPVAWANEAERKAPPLGVFLHESCRSFAAGRTGIGWVLNRWWLSSKLSCGKPFAKKVGKRVNGYLEWEKRNKIETGIPDGKVEEYHEAVEEYFELPRKKDNVESMKEIVKVNNNVKETK